jgi:hypothetical protein
MAWHTFEVGRAYARDDVVRLCLDHIASAGPPLNKTEKRAHVNEIARLPDEVVTYKPFGRAWGRSPMNARAWADRDGEPFDQSREPISLKKELHAALVEAYRKAGHEAGYWGNYFLRSVRKNGGLEAARRMLRRRSGDFVQKGCKL